MFPQPDPIIWSTAAGRRQFIKYSVSDELWQTVSANKLQIMFSESGVGIRRTDLLAVRREKMEEFARREALTEWGRSKLVPDELMTPKPDITMIAKYQYRYKLTVVPKHAGDPTYIYRSLSSNKRITPLEGQEECGSKFSAGGKKYDYVIVSVELQDVWTQEEVLM